MIDPNRIIQVLVGHESRRLEKKTKEEHTHKWTLFVRPANTDYKDFVDNKFISKVKFQLHESFPNPIRIVKEPPFSVSETGYASFSTVISVYMNLPNQKSHKIQYDMNLSLNEKGYHDELQKLNIKVEMPSFFVDLVNKYCLKKKVKRKSSVAIEEAVPVEKEKKQKRERDRDRHEESSKSKHKEKERKRSTPPRETKREKEREVKRDLSPVSERPASSSSSKKDMVAPSKTFPKKERESVLSSPTSSHTSPAEPTRESAEEITKKISSINDHRVMYKISEVLLNMSHAKLHATTHTLSFDLTKATSSTLLELSRILATSSSNSSSV